MKTKAYIIPEMITTELGSGVIALTQLSGETKEGGIDLVKDEGAWDDEEW